MAAEYLNGVNLFFESREEMLKAIAAYAAASPRLEVIRGYGWRAEAFGGERPSALELDFDVRDRPVILLSADLMVAWRNSRAAALPISAPEAERAADTMPNKKSEMAACGRVTPSCRPSLLQLH